MATICGGDSYGIRLLNCQYVEVRNLHLAGSGVTPRGESTNKAIGLDIYSTATAGKPWQSIHVDRVTVKGFREGIVFHTRLGVQGDPPPSFDHFRDNGIEFFKPAAGEGVVGYNDVQITNCEVGECLFSGIYGWGSAKSSGKPWFFPLGNGTFTNCRIAGCLIHDIYCDPVGDPWPGMPMASFSMPQAAPSSDAPSVIAARQPTPRARKAGSAGWCSWNAAGAWPSSTSATAW